MDEEKLDIEKTLAYFTLDEKTRMLSGDGLWHTFGAGEMPRVRMSDGPNGLRMTDDENLSAVPATCYPAPSMLACSWDPALLYSVGAGIGKEATAMGVNLLLAPAVNIKRHPLGGRNFEYYSEDPLLAGELGKAFISGVQSTGVGACVKHFAANNQETRRMYSDSVIDMRALREIYLKPFEIALEAAPEAVMCAYNKLCGEYCSQNEFLLTTVLRDEWGFDGAVISDWGAVRDRSRALAAGLDLAMPDSRGLFEQNINAALADRSITELTAAGHRVIAVLCGAGPVRMPWINRVRAVVYAGLNGQNGALAAVDALYGRINPRGKLAETFPLDLSDAGDDFGKEQTIYRESIFVGYRYYDKINHDVLFPFGHGLSFSEISYDTMTVKRIGDAEFDVTVTLTNKSARDAYEIVQLYVADRTGRVMCAQKQLAGYMKVFIEGQTSTVATVRIKRRAFEFFNVENNAFEVADGEYKIIAAASAADVRLTATVKVNGEFSGAQQYPAVYVCPIRSKITDADFEQLLGAPIEKPQPRPQRGEYTLDCCITDIQHTFAGKIAKRAVMRRADGAGEPNSPERAAFIASALNTPLSAVYAMSGGAMTANRAKGVMEIANGKLFKGLKLVLKKDSR